MLPQKYTAEIFQKEENKDLLVKLIQQLNKDFSLTGINDSFDEDCSINKMVIQLNIKIESLMKSDFQTYLNLLYRIDIPESKMIEIDEIDTEKISQKVTSLILIREWQKVWFKSRNL